jgi:hypothetical protein
LYNRIKKGGEESEIEEERLENHCPGFYDWFRSFGFGGRLGISLPGHCFGFNPMAFSGRGFGRLWIIRQNRILNFSIFSFSSVSSKRKVF